MEKPYSVKAMTAKAMYVPRMPRLAMVGRFLKKAFLRTDSPAYRIIGGRKNLHELNLVHATGWYTTYVLFMPACSCMCHELMRNSAVGSSNW